MIIDVRGSHSVFITIGNRTFYIDDSTNEQIMEHWETDPEYTKPLY